MTENIKAAKRPTSLLRMFNLRDDLDHPEEIDDAIRSGVELFGTNLWVLIFAILVACVGLNMNSTAVIIGAMLISPLMGPIVGVGYGLAIHDIALIKKALFTLLVFTLISLLTSTVYFYISPLKEPGSELLARTSPTLWDVLIAFFGGCAGIIALTRRNFSNVVPGVAIATALMPPLCTAGYSLAQGNWLWMGGALYLFSINGVFIAYAALLFVKLMRIGPRRGIEKKAIGADWRTYLTLLIMVVPSIYLGWRVVQMQDFSKTVSQAIEAETEISKAVVISRDIDAENRRVRMTIAGDLDTEQFIASLQKRLGSSKWTDTHISVQSISNKPVDVGSIRRDLQDDLARASMQQRDELRTELAQLQLQNRTSTAQEQMLSLVKTEIASQYPQFDEIAIGLARRPEKAPEQAPEGATSTVSAADTVLIVITGKQQLEPQEQKRLEDWLAVRLAPHQVRVGYIPLSNTSKQEQTAGTNKRR